MHTNSKLYPAIDGGESSRTDSPPWTSSGRLPTALVASHESDTQSRDTQQTTESGETPVSTAGTGSSPDAIPDGPVEDEAASEAEGYTLPLDQIFEILKNSRRRETIQYLKENGGETTLSEVAEHIAALENDTTVRAISSTQRKRVYVGLYQCHLPKMDDTDVVDFDQNRGTIELGPNANQLDPYIDEPQPEHWHRMYLGIVFAGAGLFGLGLAGGSSYGLTPTVVLLFIIIGITACGIAHSRQSE